ncbi:ABC-2 family transporter protein [Devosia sp.]|uniref:ABC transporter permease n=1 Tax=Devosia sp. TaxID=1871048 RepID=UPI0032667710
MQQAFRVIPFLVHLYVKSRMEYRSAFLLAIGAQFFSYACGFTSLWVMLLRFDTLGGWSWPQLALLFSFQLLTYSLGAATSFVQLRDIEEKVRLGTFDTLLVKPFSPWAYLVFSGLNIGYAGHIALAAGLMAWALTQVGVDWNFGTVAYLVAATISAAMVNAAIITMIGATAFIVVQSSHLYTIFFGVWELSRYPLNIFPAVLQWTLLTIVPLGFASYVPMAYLIGKDIAVLGSWGGPLSLLAGPVLVLLAMAHWRFAISKYQGAGG